MLNSNISRKNTENDLFHWLLNSINQISVHFKHQYSNNQTSVVIITSEFCLHTNKSQQQIHQSNRLNRDENSYSIVCKHSDVDRQKKHHFKKIFTSTNLSPSIQINIIKKTPSDKDDYPRRKKRQSNSVNIISNRVNDDIISTQMITDALTEGHFLHKSNKNLLVCQQFFLQNLSQISGLHIFNPLSNHIDKYAQKIPHVISTKINKQGLKYFFSSKLRNLRKRFVQRVFLSRKNNCKSKYRIFLKNRIIDKSLSYQIQVFTNASSSRYLPSSKLNKNSKFKSPSVSYNVKNVSLRSNSSPINLHTFCGQTYDRSTSAYTRSDRQHSSYRRMKDEIDQSTPANILSRVAEKLDKNEIEYLTAPNTFKYGNKYHSTQKQPSDSSDIYIKLLDCQAACRRWAAQYNKRNRFSSHAHPHHRHRKTKLPICYRNFPLSLNALSKYNNTRKRYIDRYHINPTHHPLNTQVKSEKDMQTKISVDIRKVSCKDIHSNKKVQDSFICFGTASIDFIDGRNGPTLCLKQGDSKNEEEICLYRRSSNYQLDFGDGNEYEQKQYQPIFKQVDESSFDTVLKPFSISSLSINPEISPVDEAVTCTTHQSPLATTLIFDRIPACILTLINRMTRMSMTQIPSLSCIVSMSDAANLRQSLNMRLIDNIKNLQDYQEVILDDDDRDQSSISNYFTDLDNQNPVDLQQERSNMTESDQDFGSKEKNEEDQSSKTQVFEPLPSTNQFIFETKTSVSNAKDEQNIISNGNELLAHRYALDPPETRTTEEQDPEFIVDNDQNKRQKNLIENEENNHDLHSRTVITSNLSIDQYFGISTIIDETKEQEIIRSSNSSEISLISDRINPRSISEREDQFEPIKKRSYDNEIAYSDVSLSISTSSVTQEDQLLELFGETSIAANQSDSEMSLLPLTERPHSLRSKEISESLNDHFIDSIQPTTKGDGIDSPISTSYIDGIRSTSITNHYSRLDEATLTTLSREKQQTLNETHITIPRCVHLCDSFEQTINQNSDPLLSPAVIPNHLSTSLETKASISYSEKSTFPEHHILQNSDDGQQSSQIEDIYPNENTISKHAVSCQSKTSLPKTFSSGLKYPPLMATSLSKRKTSFDSADLHLSEPSSEPLSIQTDSSIQDLDKHQISRIMAIPRKSIDNGIEDKDLSFEKRPKRHYIQNQLSDLQIDQRSIDSSSPILANPFKYKPKNKLTVGPTNSTRRQKFIRKKQLCIRPSWVSPNKTPTPTNSSLIKKSMHRTSFPLKQLRDPCEILELYTQFKPIYCQPYECICTPLPPCYHISPCSFIKNARI